MKILQLLDEGINLNLGTLKSSYGSWMHADQSNPILVHDKQGHEKVANKMRSDTSQNGNVHKQMIDAGWVRCVHDNLNYFGISGSQQGLIALIPQLVELRNFVYQIDIDVKDCKGFYCRTIKSYDFEMPGEWNKLRRYIANIK